MIIGEKINGIMKCHQKMCNSLSDETRKTINRSLDADIFTRFFNDMYDEVEDIAFILDDYFYN